MQTLWLQTAFTCVSKSGPPVQQFMLQRVYSVCSVKGGCQLAFGLYTQLPMYTPNPECRDTNASDPHETSRVTRHVRCNDSCDGDVGVHRQKHRPCCQYQKVAMLPCATNMSMACTQPCDFDVYGRLNKTAHKASELLLWICHNACIRAGPFPVLSANHSHI